MADITEIAGKVTNIHFGGNVIYNLAFGTIIVSGDSMQIIFFNGVQQHFTFDQFTTTEPTFEAYIDSLIESNHFRVPVIDSEGNDLLSILITGQSQSNEDLNDIKSNTKILNCILEAVNLTNQLLIEILN